jgi:nucleotide-binding universal stress UspA family protein
MDDNLIVIATDNYSSALVLQSFLESNGIDCFLKNVNLVQPHVSEGVKVQIKEVDVEKALNLLSFFNYSQKGELGPRKILVPVDFSETSRNAAFFAIKLAHKYGAEIKLLHLFTSPIVDMIPFSDAASIQIDVDISYQVLQKNAKEKLLKFHAELKDYALQQGIPEVRIGYSLRESYVSYGIVEMCQTYKPGMVIMGTKRDGFRSTELLGSTAAEVVSETGIPILVIPEKAALKDIDEVKNVLYVTNLDDADYQALRKLITILSVFNVDISCAHISNDPDNNVAKALMKNMENYFNKVSKKVHIQFNTLEAQKKRDVLKDYIKTKRINLVSVTMHKRNLLERLINPSLTRKMLNEADMPLLIFPG